MTDQNDASDCPPEVLPEVPAAAAARLRQLLGGRQSGRGRGYDVDEFRSRLQEWLALASEAGLLVPPEFIVPLLDHKDEAIMFADLSVVVGERGRRLARGKLIWESRAWPRPPGDPAAELRRGSRLNRIRALEILRAADPNRGRELLAAARDDSDDRTLFGAMCGLRVGLSSDDEPFLESVLDSEAQPLVKNEAKALLWLLPGSTFAERARARAWATVRISWSPTGAAVSVIGSPSAVELRELVSWTQPTDWPAEVLRAVVRTEWAREIIAGIVEGALRIYRTDSPTGFREMARALIELLDPDANFMNRPNLDDAHALLLGLPQDQAEDVVMGQLHERPVVGLHLGNSLGNVWTRWSRQRSAAHLYALLELPRAKALSRSGTWLGLRAFAHRGDPALLEEAETVLQGLVSRQPATAEEVRWALDELRFRRLMREEITDGLRVIRPT